MSKKPRTHFGGVVVPCQPHIFKAIPFPVCLVHSVDKSSQKYIAFVKLGSKGAGPLYGETMKWKQTPMDGVTLSEVDQVFGKWDFGNFL